MFATVRATSTEASEPRPGDRLVARPAAVMDRAFTVPGRPEEVWPWLEQLGKRRAGWYLPRRVERLLPRHRRALHRIESRWLGLAPGDVIPDYGGRDETFTVAEIAAPSTLVYSSLRGGADVSWSIVLRAVGESDTRVLLRLRIGPLKRPWLAHTGGELLDVLTVAGLAAGLRERLVADGPGT